jgi:integrase
MHKLKEAGPRQGFFEREQFEAVRRHLRPDLQLAATICYQLGWRVRSEVLTLERRQVDLDAGTLRLEPGTTKNDEGRFCYVTPELRAMLAAQVERVRALERKTGRIIAALFPHLQGAHERKPGLRGRVVGEPMRNFRRAWATACKAAGVAGINASVPERVAMKVTGHKTRAVFDRYHIVSPLGVDGRSVSV